MGTPGFDDGPELSALLLEHFVQALDGRNQDFVQLGQSGQVHRRRDDIVGRLLAVDVVVRVDEFRPELTA